MVGFIGSGAFPMGLLRELYNCRKAIEGIDDEKAVNIKTHIIQNNIYGVDIEKGAVDIARLRFWLALIVDEQAPHALPNLDFKIMQGNSLLEQFEGVDLSGMSLNEQEQKRTRKGKAWQAYFAFDEHDALTNIQHAIKEYYNSDNHAQKVVLRNVINENVRNYILTLKGCTPDIKQKIKELPIPNDKFFLWHIYFKEVFDKGGFDIVIGNPPYIKEDFNNAAFNGFKEFSPYYMGKMDIWYGFACNGIDLMSENGIMTLIAQNNWTTSTGARILRNKIISDTRILQMIDFNEYMVFEGSASIQTMIMLFQHDKNSNNYIVDYRRLKKYAQREDMLSLLQKTKTNCCLYHKPIVNRDEFKNSYIVFNEQESLLRKIANCKFHLLDEDATNGIHPHYDFVNNKIKKNHPETTVGEGIFGLSQIEKDGLHLSRLELSLIRPYYTSEQVKTYYTNKNNNLWIIYTDSKFKKPDSMIPYPNLKAHLDKFKDVISSDNKPYGLHRARKESFFRGEKIAVLRKCVGRPSFSYSDFDCYLSATFYVIKTERWDMKFLTGLLNSKLIAFWLRSKGKMQGGNYQLDKEPLLAIPLPDISCNQHEISELTNQIITLKQKFEHADTSALEHEIDQLVYQLYGLTDEEIAIVEGNNE